MMIIIEIHKYMGKEGKIEKEKITRKGKREEIQKEKGNGRNLVIVTIASSLITVQKKKKKKRVMSITAQ